MPPRSFEPPALEDLVGELGLVARICGSKEDAEVFHVR